jgi:hypothetical protein
MFQKYLDYIRNTGGNPKIAWFDADWEPIGPQVRKQMKDAGLIYEQDDKIFIDEA